MASTTWSTARFHPVAVLPRQDEAQVCEPVEAQVAPVKKRRRKVHARRFRLPSISIRPILFVPLNAIHRAVDWGFLAAIGVLLALFSLQFPHSPEWDRLWLVLQVRELGDPIVARVALWANLGWPSSSMSYLPLGLALVAWISKSTVDAFFLPILGFLRRRGPSPEQVMESLALFGGAGVDVPADSEQARGLLLNRYREIERTLKAAKRKRCVFLSIDVAGSTQMKEGEREMAITVTFQAYMEMLQEIFGQHSAWKEAWTPDGVMICFLQVDLAVAAAQSVLRRLRKFNRTENMLRTPISVRCGLNEGEVSIFEDTNLEKFAHRVIDVSGHMQKHAQPNTLWLSTEVYDQLSDQSGFKPAGREVDGHEVFEWSPSMPGQSSAHLKLHQFEN